MCHRRRLRPTCVIGALACLACCFPVKFSTFAVADDHQTTARERNVADKLPPLIRTAKSGNWSDAATWEGGKLPAAGQRVQIRTPHRVVYDVKSDAVIRSIHVAGTLTFAPDRDTRLDVGLIKIQPGDDPSEEGFDCEAHVEDLGHGARRPALLVGTPERPIDAAHTALIRLHYIAAHDQESCPAIVCCGGRMDFHGAAMSRTWVKLGGTAAAGASAISLAEPVNGWRAGDRIILTATKREYGADGSFTEERIVKSIDGTSVTLDRPLDHEHAGDGGYRGEVANLSRNVIVESADPAGERGHTMYHVHSQGSISFAEFRHLGKKGVLGRYSIHFHLVGDTMRGSYVQGASVWDSHNRWITIHGTNYLVVRDCVGYKSIGHGFFCEDGTEVFNVLDRNLAVGARAGKRLPKQMLGFDQNEGAGFWWANSLNTFTRNVAADNDQYGFRFEATASRQHPLVFSIQQADGSASDVDIRKLPFVRFDDNEAHSSVGLYGVNLGEGVNRAGPNAAHPFVVRNLKIWDVHYAFRPQVPSLLVENLTIHQAAYGIYHPNYDNHVYRNVTISETNTEPFNRGHDDLSAQYGVLTVDGLTLARIRSGGNMPIIQISDDNPSGRGASHFRNVKLVNWTGSRERSLVNLGGGPRPQPKTPEGVPIYLHDWFGPGRHVLVVSTRSAEYKESPERYRAEPQVTGDESRLVEVADVSFPEQLNPVDDLPPATVITHVRREGDKLLVRGTTSDNGAVKEVSVSGISAKALAANFAEWEAAVPVAKASTNTGSLQLSAHSIDEAGNAEPRAHVIAVALAAVAQDDRPTAYDLVIRGGKIVDGSGNPWFFGDVAIRGDRIAVIGSVPAGGAKREIDARGLVVAPGFIDMHSHSDFTLFEDGNAQSKVRQGVTTDVLGEGSSGGPNTGKLSPKLVRVGDGTLEIRSLADYFRAVEEATTSINIASYVGIGNVWQGVMGNSFERPTPEQIGQMQQLVGEAMRDGAFGLSTQVMMPPGSLATTEDLVALCEPVRKYGGIYSSHIRNEGVGVFDSVAEAIAVGERAGVPVDVIHIKIADQQSWGLMRGVLDLIEKARARGVNVQANVYPYTRGNNNLSSIIPPWAHEGGRDKMLARLKNPADRQRLKQDVNGGVPGWYNHYTAVGKDWSRMLVSADNQYRGMTMDKIIARKSEGITPTPDPLDVLFDLLIEQNGSVGTVYAHHDERDMNLAMQQPWCSIGSDGSALAIDGPLRRGNPHPRNFGTFPRVLGVYVRERGVLRLEDAIRKMTSLNAAKLGIGDRGLLRAGLFADITVFDPDKIIDRATYTEPFQYNEGLAFVIVNGQMVLEGEKHTGARPGRALRHTSALVERTAESANKH